MHNKLFQGRVTVKIFQLCNFLLKIIIILIFMLNPNRDIVFWVRHYALVLIHACKEHQQVKNQNIWQPCNKSDIILQSLLIQVVYIDRVRLEYHLFKIIQVNFTKGYPPQRVCECMLFLTCPSFLLGQLGTFALMKLLAKLWWGNFFIKMKSYLLKV